MGEGVSVGVSDSWYLWSSRGLGPDGVGRPVPHVVVCSGSRLGGRPRRCVDVALSSFYTVRTFIITMRDCCASASVCYSLLRQRVSAVAVASAFAARTLARHNRL